MGGLGDIRAGPVDRPVIAWSVAQRAKRGEVESGDLYVVKARSECTCVAVIDGLGHGAEAAKAARRAADVVESHTDQSLESLARSCHAALQATRGAVMGFAVFRAGAGDMQWLGIGNIQGFLLTSPATPGANRVTLLSRGGIVGYRLPAVLASRVPLIRDDLVIVTTDGIRGDFADRLTWGAPIPELANHILSRYGQESDDALVLVVRYLG